ncbi:MAG: hypothetical protein KUG77_09945 [Nannocystaceae bacterium]|nr:hypothetical protein [Nannocystaceae bacterium]
MPGWRAIVGPWVILMLLACGRTDLAGQRGSTTEQAGTSGEDSTTLPPGAQCIVNLDCLDSSICVGEACVCITGCNPCDGDEDCPSGLSCEAGTCRGGRACAQDEQCAPAQGCIDFECVPNVSCAFNEECEDTQICNDGFCDAGSECTEHSHCPAGMFCQNDDCKDYVGG